MFKRARRTVPALPEPTAPYTPPSWLTRQPVPHHVPDWIAFWTEPDLPTLDAAADLLTKLHGDLLTEAEHGPGRDTYVQAAKQVSSVLNVVTAPSVARGEANVIEPVRRFVDELVRVLRDWDHSTDAGELYKAFAVAEGWIDHARAQQNAAIARHHSEFLAPLP